MVTQIEREGIGQDDGLLRADFTTNHTLSFEYMEVMARWESVADTGSRISSARGRSLLGYQPEQATARDWKPGGMYASVRARTASGGGRPLVGRRWAG